MLPAPSSQGAELLVSKIEGGQLLDGGYLSEVGNAGIDLFFNEGSKFELSPGTRGRLRVATSEGTRLAIEHGKASFQITESRTRRWAVEAGPFVVTVRGTNFAVIWDPTHEELEVSLTRGRVAVRAPVVGDQLVLRPGQTLTVSLPRRESIIKEGHSKTASVSKPENSDDGEPSSAPTGSAPRSAANAKGSSQALRHAEAEASASASVSERAWKEAIAKGQWDRVLADVDREGVSKTLGTLSSENLLALADAARYRRRANLARAALLEHRRRFPGSPRSLDALFLLGRVEESGLSKAQAIQRYEEYLARAPGGTYAAEALGRRMILTKDVQGPESASRIAEEYLRRFPGGSYAEAARALRDAR
jgi:TolA-binding protein